MRERVMVTSTLKKMKRRTSVRGRIGLGFTAILGLHLAVVFLNHIGLQRAATTSRTVEQLQFDVTRFLEMDRDVVSLQRNVLSYMYSGDAGLAERIGRDVTELEDRLEQIAASAEQSAGEDDLAQMLQALREYRRGLTQVVANRGLQTELMRDSVEPFTRAASEALTTAIGELSSTDRSAAVVDASRCLGLLRSTEHDLIAYLSDPSGDLARRIRMSCNAFERSVEELAEVELSRGASEELRKVRSRIDDWRVASFQTINATRSFLHLVNVVLAGQATEFRRLSGRLTEGALDKQATTAAILAADQGRFGKISNTVGILTIIIGLFAGLWVSASIAKPIISMTETFSALADGREVDVPGDQRVDEIGDLAKAAKVFAARNKEARVLLDQTRAMAMERESTNAELRAKVVELHARNEDLDRFSYSASHDLRAPLRSIALLAEWVENDSGHLLPDDSRVHLVTLKERTKRLDQLLSGILRYARVGRAEDLAEDIELVSFLAEVADSLEASQSANVVVTGDPIMVEAPKVALHEVFQNLVTNAISHHDRDDPNVEIDVRAEGDCAVIAVRDDGPGIDPAFQEKVFEIFQTVRSRDEHESSGVGLAIVQKTVLHHGASISLKSGPERGCTFTVRWPIRRRTDGIELPETEPAISKSPVGFESGSA